MTKQAFLESGFYGVVTVGRVEQDQQSERVHIASLERRSREQVLHDLRRCGLESGTEWVAVGFESSTVESFAVSLQASKTRQYGWRQLAIAWLERCREQAGVERAHWALLPTATGVELLNGVDSKMIDLPPIEDFRNAVVGAFLDRAQDVREAGARPEHLDQWLVRVLSKGALEGRVRWDEGSHLTIPASVLTERLDEPKQLIWQALREAAKVCQLRDTDTIYIPDVGRFMLGTDKELQDALGSALIGTLDVRLASQLLPSSADSAEGPKVDRRPSRNHSGNAAAKRYADRQSRPRAGGVAVSVAILLTVINLGILLWLYVGPNSAPAGPAIQGAGTAILEGKIEGIRDMTEAHGKRVESVVQEFASLRDSAAEKQELAALRNQIGGFEAQLAGVNGAIETMRSDIQSATTSVSGIESAVAQLTESLNAAERTALPVGAIVIWAGELTSLPENWKVCDGEDSKDPRARVTGVPDLRNTFVRGAGSPTDLGRRGGADMAPPHSHKVTGTATNISFDSRSVADYAETLHQVRSGSNLISHPYLITMPIDTRNGESHGHKDGSGDVQGRTSADGAHSTLPPYRNVHYIIRLW